MNDTIDLFGPIGPGGYTEAHLAEALKPHAGKPVTLRISSVGGCAFTGLAMAAIVRQHGQVHAVAVGLCASAATFPFFAATRASMATESTLMLHSPASTVGGDAETLRATADLLDRVEGQIVQLYADRAKKTADEVRAWLGEGEKWFDATEALAAGLIDEIATVGAQSFTTSAKWSFTNAPQSIAAKLDPTTDLRAEVATLKGDLQTARAELAEARKTIESSARLVIVAPDVAQRSSIEASAENNSDPYAAHMRRVKALRNQ